MPYSFWPTIKTGSFVWLQDDMRLFKLMVIAKDKNSEGLKNTIEVVLDSYKARVRVAESIAC